IAADMAEAGGRLSAADLAGYRARLVDPLEIAYRGATVAATPALTAGPTLARVLELLTPALTEAERHAGRPGAASYVAYAEALNAAYAERLAGEGGDGEPGPRPGDPGPAGDTRASCTSHLSVVDRDGNMAA